jgi:biotin transport system substrate-specific component
MGVYSSYPKTRGIALAATFAALISVMAPISIPITPQVPLTLQVFVVFLTIGLLGPLYGGLSMVIYLLLGAVGLPVYANLSSGTATLFGPTGGYLFAFPIASSVGGLLARSRGANKRSDAIRVSIAALVALVIIYGLGVVWLSAYFHISLLDGFIGGALFFIPFDIIKAVIAVPICVRLRWSHLQLPIRVEIPPTPIAT